MNKNGRGMNLVISLLLIVLLVFWFSGILRSMEDTCTQAEFNQMLDAGEISGAVVVQNREVPTGSVEVHLTSGDEKVLVVSDVNPVLEELETAGVKTIVRDVPGDNIFLTSILPALITVGGVLLIFMMMNAQNAQMNGGNKMMNFGKSRARLSLAGDSKVTLKDVAGLKEEKEDLQEIVDFLRDPGKFTKVGARIPKGVLLEGPPGTGKTTTLVEAIYETLHRENQVLVCAQSNMAVDWISEKLVDRGINVLRIGNPTRVNDKMLSFTYERRFESHPDYSELWSIRKAIRELHGKSRSAGHENIRAKIAALKDRATELEIRINESLFGEARVIASTLISSANRTLTGRRFSTLFIDEAAQALEAACWVAIRKADRVVFAGDHCQLPPTIKCIEAARRGLDRTLMQKIAATKPESVSLLKVQYRMNDDIMHFPSLWFYHNELKSAPEVKYRGILDYDTTLEWYDTEGCEYKEEFIGENFGRINKPEAHMLMEKLEEYIHKIGIARVLEERIDFGLISPYKAQVQYLRQLLRRSNFFKPFRQLITINTVDGFQGQERDVILISLVRANEDGQIGFLNDLRRMNVAITRARMKLIILGDASTLTRHAFYKKLYEYIQERGVIKHIMPHQEDPEVTS